MPFGHENEFIEGNPFRDLSETPEPKVGEAFSDAENKVEAITNPDHSFEAFVEDFKFVYENESDLHLLKINPDDLGQEDANIWFKFRESGPGNFVLNIEDLINYQSYVSFHPNPSRNNLLGYISNKIVYLWQENGMIREESVGPKGSGNKK